MNLVRAGFSPLFKQDFYQSNWRLTHRYNFACSYCINQETRIVSAELSEALMLQTMKYLCPTDKSRYHCALSGGEVTLYPHLEEMLRTINEWFRGKQCGINLLSNGSASIDKMRSLLRAAAPHNIMFIITLHLDHIDMDTFAANLATFSDTERAKFFLVKLIAAPGNMPQALKAKKMLDDARLANYRIQHVLDFDTGIISPEYTQEELDLITSLRAERPAAKYMQLFNEYEDGEQRIIKTFTYTQGVEQRLLDYRGMYCAAGYTSFRVDEFGEIRKSRLYGDMGYTAAERNPFTDPNFITPVRCPAAHCTCISYSRLPKWMHSADAPEYVKQDTEAYAWR